MYRQILVHPADRDLQRIVWREDQEHPIREYRLNTVTYGLACAPFLAIRTLHQLAEDERPRFPAGAAVLIRDVYVDDILSGDASVDRTRDMLNQTRELCKAGGFPLRKWAANDPQLLDSIPEEDLSAPGARLWSQGSSHPTLGLQWHPEQDSFSFCVRPIDIGVVTRRSVLSRAAQLFDPLGWLAPAVVQAKILLQGTWLQGLGWDTPLTPKDEQRWRNFLTDLPRLKQLQVPRWLGCFTEDGIEIHGFADASERAYAGVVYLRSRPARNTSEEWRSTLVTAKTRVAPLKQITLPRLELCAATLLVRLVDHVQKQLNLRDRPVFLWSDSTVTLGWIRGHPSQWKTFVANRVRDPDDSAGCTMVPRGWLRQPR